nr:AbgT family transporter [Nonomuraea basaltis]
MDDRNLERRPAGEHVRGHDRFALAEHAAPPARRAYGRAAGTVTSSRDIPGFMAHGLRETAPILVLFFAISQFLAYFKWTGIGEIIAIDANAITPMSPYFVMALGFLQRYRRAAGIGTLASMTIPLAFTLLVVWTLLFFAFWWLGSPLGPGAPVR